MKKALVAASVASMIDQFTIPNIKALIDLGYEVDVAANFEDGGSITEDRAKGLISRLEEMGARVINTPIPRGPLAFGKIIKSYRIIKRISRENKYGIMHCHSPIGGAVARLGVRKERKTGTRVIYTAHGFHFYKGAPKKNWLLYYPVEKLCARFTDVLLTINREDYELAKRKLRAGRVEYVPGVGIDVEKFSSVAVDKAEKKASLGIPVDAPVIFSVGELNQNKNHEVILRALAKINTDAYYVIAGKGALEGELTKIALELGISERVHLLGYREDVAELYGIADVFAHPSYREGLPVSVMEAMASCLPIVASRIRGNVDLIKDEGGYLVAPCDVGGFAEALESVLSSSDKRAKMGAYNRAEAKKYSYEAIEKTILDIYEK